METTPFWIDFFGGLARRHDAHHEKFSINSGAGGCWGMGRMGFGGMNSL